MVNRLHRNQVEWSMTTEIRWKQGFDTISIHIDNVSSLAIYITGLYSNFKGWQRWCYWILLIYFNFLSLLIVSSFSQKIVHVDFWVSFTIITSEISCFIKFSFSMFHIFWQQERLWQVNCTVGLEINVRKPSLPIFFSFMASICYLPIELNYKWQYSMCFDSKYSLKYTVYIYKCQICKILKVL